MVMLMSPTTATANNGFSQPSPLPAAAYLKRTQEAEQGGDRIEPTTVLSPSDNLLRGTYEVVRNKKGKNSSAIPRTSLIGGAAGIVFGLRNGDRRWRCSSPAADQCRRFGNATRGQQ
jgi:hypothetical protein